MKRYFVTGTDTGVGKTFVTTQLARRARARVPQAQVFAFKPVETGCAHRFGDDQEALADAAGDWQQGVLRGAYQFRLAAAPLVAALAESKTIDLDFIRDTVQLGSVGATHVLVEGAGGWRVPITETVDMAGLARIMGFPVIIVGRAGLGTISHCLLTIEAAERDGATIEALILSQRADDDPAFAASNAEQIQHRWPGLVLVLASDVSVLDVLL
jgi:dethiobiotin synthetase